MDIYAFDPPAPADAGTLNNVAVNSTDEVLKGLLRADITSVPRRIAGWENHRENLPEDPSQVSHASVTTCTTSACITYVYIYHADMLGLSYSLMLTIYQIHCQDIQVQQLCQVSALSADGICQQLLVFTLLCVNFDPACCLIGPLLLQRVMYPSQHICAFPCQTC